MKRLIPGLLLALGVSSVANAAPSSPPRGLVTTVARAVRGSDLSRTQFVTQSARLLRQLATTTAQPLAMGAARTALRRGGGSLLPRAVAGAPARLSATAIGLPQELLTAGNGTQTAAAAQAGDFSGFHKTWTGYQSGIQADFTFDYSIMGYRGSVFADAASAHTYWNEGVQAIAAVGGEAPVDCSDATLTSCDVTGFVGTVNNVKVEMLYIAAPFGTCVIENAVIGDPTQMDANRDTVTKLLVDTFAVGVNEALKVCGTTPVQPPPTTVTPTPTPTPVKTDFTVDEVRIQKSDKLGAPAVSSVKAGARVYMVIYWTVNSLPAGTVPTYGYQVVGKSHGKTVASGQNSAPGTLADYPPGQHAASFAFQLKRAGSYTFSGSVSANGVSQSGGTTVKVKAKKKKKA